jgi:hypothetical protein
VILTIYNTWHLHTGYVSERTEKITDKMEKKSDNFIDTGSERQLLKLTRSKTKAILEKGNLDKIIRHKERWGKL